MKPTRVTVGEKDGKRMRVGRRSQASLEVEISRRAAKRGTKDKSGGKKAASSSEGGED